MSKVKVRVAVAVDRNGEWNAAGWRGGYDIAMMDVAVGAVGEGEAHYFLEAELEIPEPVTVQAEVAG